MGWCGRCRSSWFNGLNDAKESVMIIYREPANDTFQQPCFWKVWMEKCTTQKKKKCCKSFREGKRCKKCPKK